MSRMRSPNCPQIPFIEAIEQGRKVYQKEHTHPAAKAVIASDLGYKGISGASLSMIGSLRQYGILDGTAEAMRVSEDAVAYYVLDDGPEKIQAAARMAFKPSLFEEMKSQFGGTTPSDANLKHWLIKKGFIPKAADDIILVYKQNITLAGGEESGYSGGDSRLGGSPMNAILTQQNTQKQQPAPGSVQTYTYPLSATSRAELSLKGDITPEDLEMLRDNIELTIKALTRKAKTEASE